MSFKSKLIATLYNSPDIFATGFFSGIKSPLFNKLRMNFWSLVVKKQAQYKSFYRNCAHTKDLTILDLATTREDAPNRLKEFGIALINDVLDKRELDEFISISNDCLINTKKLKFGDGVIAEQERILDTDKSSVKTLADIADSIFSECIGRSTKESVHIYIQRLVKPANTRDLNDKNCIMHSDRFIPTIKIFFYPFGVEPGHSQFEFIPYTHLVNQDFFDSYNDFYSKVASGEIGAAPGAIKNHTNSKKLKLVVPPNSLLICATNGIHRRSPFEDRLTHVQAERFSAQIVL